MFRRRKPHSSSVDDSGTVPSDGRISVNRLGDATASDSSRTRAISQMSFQQRAILEQMEGLIRDPDQLLNLFRLRNLVAKVNHEAEFLQILAGEMPPTHDAHARRASTVARSATEACRAFENVRVEVRNDSFLKPAVVTGVGNLLTQLMNRALDAEPFAVVHLSVDAVRGSAVFEVVDHAKGFGEAELRALGSKVVDQGGPVAGNLAEEGMWAVNTLTQTLPITLNFHFEPGVLGATARLAVDEEGMDRAENAAPEPVARARWSPIPPPPKPRVNPVAAAPARLTAEPAPSSIRAEVEEQAPPPLYLAALAKMRRKATIRPVTNQTEQRSA